MFEIGSSLREARLRQGLDFPELEQVTKIRGKYLRALEDEQFDVLPAQTYVKGFLRNYAEFLGLDGQLYVDEYNSRYVVGEEEPLSRPRRSQPQRRAPHVQSRVVLLTVLGIAVVAGLVIVAWRGPDAKKNVIPGLGTTQTPGVVTKTVAAPKRRAPTVARLQVTALLDATWLQVHRGGASGPVVYQGTLEKGERQLFVARRLWVDVGRPEVLRARLNGRLVHLPAGGPRVVVVTARGIRAATGT
jgi:cytoskeleton protein RodZ